MCDSNSATLDAAAALIPAGVLPKAMPRRDTYATLNREVPDRGDTYAKVSPRSHKACQLPW
jgi:hypothetical protein